MSAFDDARKKLDDIQQRLQKEGATPELTKELNDLFAFASIYVFLGPNDSITRGDETEGREYPDERDLKYYEEAFDGADFSEFFKSLGLGAVTVTYETVVIQGITFPGCRVSWENKYQFLDVVDSESFKSSFEAALNLLATMLGCRWHDWRVQAVKT